MADREDRKRIETHSTWQVAWHRVVYQVRAGEVSADSAEEAARQLLQLHGTCPESVTTGEISEEGPYEQMDDAAQIDDQLDAIGSGSDSLLGIRILWSRRSWTPALVRVVKQYADDDGVRDLVLPPILICLDSTKRTHQGATPSASGQPTNLRRRTRRDPRNFARGCLALDTNADSRIRELAGETELPSLERPNGLEIQVCEWNPLWDDLSANSEHGSYLFQVDHERVSPNDSSLTDEAVAWLRERLKTDEGLGACAIDRQELDS